MIINFWINSSYLFEYINISSWSTALSSHKSPVYGSEFEHNSSEEYICQIYYVFKLDWKLTSFIIKIIWKKNPSFTFLCFVSSPSTPRSSLQQVIPH